MKISTTSLGLVFTLLLSWAIDARAEQIYKLQTGTAYTKTYTIDNNPPNGTRWGNFMKCGDFLSQSIPIEFSLYEINNRDFEKSKLECLSLENGTTAQTNWIFNTTGSGASEFINILDDTVSYDFDYDFPVGVHILTESNKLDHIGFVTSSGSDVISKLNEPISGNINDDDINRNNALHTEWRDYIPHLTSMGRGDYYSLESLSGPYLACRPGDIVTGINFQYNTEGGSNNNERAEIRAVKIQCRTLKRY